MYMHVRIRSIVNTTLALNILSKKNNRSNIDPCLLDYYIETMHTKLGMHTQPLYNAMCLS